MPELTVNGEARWFAEDEFPHSIGDLAAVLGLEVLSLAAEVEGEIIARDAIEKTSLRPGQTVELVRFIGGG